MKPSVQTAFDRCAREYDQTRKQFIPCFNDFYGAVTTLLRSTNENPTELLDLGAGTGLLSAFVLDGLPHAQIKLVDISGEMLEQARERFKTQPGHVEFEQANYATQSIAGSYDAVVSALSIHHLTGEQKAELFKKIHGCLKPGGLFINADQVMGGTAEIEAVYRRVWYEAMEAADIDPEVMRGAEERMKEDKMSTLADQLDWLKQAGFTDVNCWYKQFSFAVYSGRKAV